MRFPKYVPAVISTLLLSLSSAGLFAHAQLNMNSATPPRYNSDAVKASAMTGPACGNPGSLTPTGIKSIFAQGETVNVQWTQVIYHTDNYYVDFSPANDENFTPSSPTPIIDIKDITAYAAPFTLDYPPCEACTLRLRQFMGSDSVYFSCADIAIYDPTDSSPPELVNNISVSSTHNSATLTWTNPVTGDFSEVVIVRKTLASTNMGVDEILTNHAYYKVNDLVGTESAKVVYSGKLATFVDTNLSAETLYAYKIFARDSNYNYNTGTFETTTTLSAPPGGGTPGTTPGTNPGSSSTSSDSGGGALSGLLLLSLSAWGVYYFRSRKTSNM